MPAGTTSAVQGASTLEVLIASFERSLRAANRSPRTIRTYGDDARALARMLSERGWSTVVGDIRREHVEAFIEDQLARFRPASAAVRYRSLQQLFKWLVEEGEIASSPMAKMRPPTVPETPVPVVGDDDLRKLLRVCEGKAFDQRRDSALLRLMIDTGVRLSEVSGLRIEDVDFNTEVVVVLGKGRRPRAVPFGSKTSVALDRYVRVRATHSHARLPALWLGARGALTDSGVTQILRRRCAEASIDRIHPHQLRHTAASAWLAVGGSEGDAMRLFGWKSREMLSRYGAAAADERAKDAYRRLLPGDRL